MSAPRYEAPSRAAELQRAFDQTFAEPRASLAQDHEDLIQVRVTHDSYAQRLSEVLGLYVDQTIVPLPSAAPGLLGISGVRGRLVVVYDLGTLLTQAPAGRRRFMVVLQAAPDVALAFDVFEGHLRVARHDILEAVGHEAATANASRVPHATHYARTAAGRVPLVALGSILEVITTLAR